MLSPSWASSGLQWIPSLKELSEVEIYIHFSRSKRDMSRFEHKNLSICHWWSLFLKNSWGNDSESAKVSHSILLKALAIWGRGIGKRDRREHWQFITSMGHQGIQVQSMAACIGKTPAFIQEKAIGNYWLKKKKEKILANSRTVFTVFFAYLTFVEWFPKLKLSHGKAKKQ